MARDISITLMAEDKVSGQITIMKNAVGGFKKDVGGLQDKLDMLNNTNTKLKSSYVLLGEELKKAKKDMISYNDETSKTKYEDTLKEHEKLKTLISSTGKAAKQTTNEMNKLADSGQKQANRAGSSFAKSGVPKQLWESVNSVISHDIGAMFGPELGASINSTLSGAISGATMGSGAGHIGAAIGGVLGGLSGFIQGEVEKSMKWEETFKTVKSGIMSEQSASAEQKKLSGIELSGGQEVVFEAWLRRFDGDKEFTEEFLHQCRVLIESPRSILTSWIESPKPIKFMAGMLTK